MSAWSWRLWVSLSAWTRPLWSMSPWVSRGRVNSEDTSTSGLYREQCNILKSFLSSQFCIFKRSFVCVHIHTWLVRCPGKSFRLSAGWGEWKSLLGRYMFTSENRQETEKDRKKWMEMYKDKWCTLCLVRQMHSWFVLLSNYSFFVFLLCLYCLFKGTVHPKWQFCHHLLTIMSV